MTIMDAVRLFDAIPRSARPPGLPSLPGYEGDDPLWAVSLVGAVLSLEDGRLDRCVTPHDLELALADFIRDLRDEELTMRDWRYGTGLAIVEYREFCRRVAAAQNN